MTTNRSFTFLIVLLALLVLPGVAFARDTVVRVNASAGEVYMATLDCLQDGNFNVTDSDKDSGRIRAEKVNPLQGPVSMFTANFLRILVRERDGYAEVRISSRKGVDSLLEALERSLGKTLTRVEEEQKKK